MMTGKDLISVITACNMEDCEIEVDKGGKPMNLTGLDIGGDKIIFVVEE